MKYSSLNSRWFAVALIFGLCLSCAPGSKKNETNENAAEGVESDQPSPPADQSEVKDQEVIPPPKVTSVLPASPKDLPEKYKKLQLAIKTRQESAILKEVGLLLAQDATDVVALNGLSVYRMNKGQLKAARMLLEQALKNHPKEAALYNNLGIVAYREKDLDGAFSYFQNGYRANPNNANIKANLGSFYLRYGDPKKAYPLLKEAYGELKNSEFVAQNYAVVLKSQGEFKESEKIFAGLMRGEAHDVYLLLNYAILLVEHLNKPDQAQSILNKISFLGTDDKDVQTKVEELERKIRNGKPSLPTE